MRGLLEAIIKDLDEYELTNDENARKIYVSYLLDVAHHDMDDVNNTHIGKYSKGKDKLQIEYEMGELEPKPPILYNPNPYLNLKENVSVRISRDYPLFAHKLNISEDTPKQKLMNAIDGLNLNNNQKEWIKNQVEQGDLSEVKNFVERNIIDPSILSDYLNASSRRM